MTGMRYCQLLIVGVRATIVVTLMSELISRFTALPAYGIGALVVVLLYALQSEIRFGPARGGSALASPIARARFSFRSPRLFQCSASYSQ